ncbi:hypothetical protein LUZ60_006396 [Juncus effusus]|nr:hypothetical protein LUZ60_006396 [Juncus effusus]
MTSNDPATAASGGGGARRNGASPRPTLTVPPRSESFFLHMASPGPLTLAASLFPEETPDNEFRSFTQLLVGAMNSPSAVPPPEQEKKAEKAAPEQEVVFTVPPGLSPTGLFSPVIGNFGISHQQALAQVTAQANLHILPQESLTDPVHHAPTQPDKPSEDGYNWRKYGQKLVKGSEFPRSYYKCTHASCPVKKKIERSVEGHITEIIYKGQHNHQKPINKRGSGNKDFLIGLTGQEVNGSDPVKRERELTLTEQISGSSESDEEAVKEDDGDSKRRNLGFVDASRVSASQRMLAEPRIIVQTPSEVDLLDDGYRWRKYGQKVVKGNPHPRSYYKCTFKECNVKKHVERSNQDPKSVITTYEGKHNHDVPAGRSTSHVAANNNYNNVGGLNSDLRNRGEVGVLRMKEEHEIT